MKTAATVLARQLVMRSDEWVARTRTGAELIAAIRSLQSVAPGAVRAHFTIADDGSFMLDTVTLVTHGA